MTRLGKDHTMTTMNHPEADCHTGRTNRTLAQYIYTKHNPEVWSESAEYVYCMTVHPYIRCLLAALVHAEAPLGDPALDLDVGRQPRLKAPAGFTKLLTSARENIGKASGR